MVSTKVVFYLLAVCGSLQAVGPRELVAVAATTTPGRRLATGAAFGAGAVAGVYALCRKLLSSKMVDSAVQTDGPTSQQIVAWLDDIVAKANEFLPQRQIIADLSEIREKKRTCQSAEVTVHDECEQIVLKRLKGYNLLASPAWESIQQSHILSLQKASALSSGMIRLNDALMYCRSDEELKNKYSYIPKLSSSGVVFTLEEACQDFGEYVALLKEDLKQK